MRDFNEADKQKKQGRIRIEENPCGLSADMLAKLDEKIRASAQDSHLPCGKAFRIADEYNVPKIAVGERVDRMGIRITNCQIGCFKVDKNLHENIDNAKMDEKIIAALNELNQADALNCAGVFELARQFKLTPMAVADAANSSGLKVRRCQLGCF
jgi:hypothetical protein